MAGDPQVNIVMHPGDVVILPTSDKLPPNIPTVKSVKPPVETGEYYVGGTNIKRVGVYSIPAEKITLKQAIIAAGGADRGFVSVTRLDEGKVSLIMDNVDYQQLLSGAVNDIYLHPHDTIMLNLLSQRHAAATQQAPTP